MTGGGCHTKSTSLFLIHPRSSASSCDLSSIYKKYQHIYKGTFGGVWRILEISPSSIISNRFHRNYSETGFNMLELQFNLLLYSSMGFNLFKISLRLDNFGWLLINFRIFNIFADLWQIYLNQLLTLKYVARSIWKVCTNDIFGMNVSKTTFWACFGHSKLFCYIPFFVNSRNPCRRHICWK